MNRVHKYFHGQMKMNDRRLFYRNKWKYVVTSWVAQGNSRKIRDFNERNFSLLKILSVFKNLLIRYSTYVIIITK